MHSKLIIIGAALIFLTCSSESGNNEADASTSVTCNCEPETAAETTYDNSESGLAAENVKAAIDEVAARPAPPVDAFDRLSEKQETQTATAGDFVILQAQCDAGGLAVGGSCESDGLDARLARTKVQLSGAYACSWSKTDGVTTNFTATVICLAPAQQN